MTTNDASTSNAKRGSGLRVAVALYASLDHDGRVLREAKSLVEAGHDVTIYCLAWQGAADTPFRVVPKVPDRTKALPDGRSPFYGQTSSNALTRTARRLGWVVDYVRNLRSWGSWAVDAAATVDVWHAHDLPALMAVAPFLGPTAKLVYDSHEIFLESGAATRIPGPLRRLLSFYERHLVRRTVAVVTVNDALAKDLTRRLRPKRTVVVHNCAPRWDPPAQPRHLLRAAAGLSDLASIALYHGALGSHRGIEQAIEALEAPRMETVDLVLLGYGNAGAAATTAAASDGTRVHIVPAVSPDDLLGWVRDADVDVIALQHSTLNHWLSSPNKLWESLGAGVPVIVSDFPVMRHIVMDDPLGPLGATCEPDDPASIAAAIRTILDRPPDERAALRERCLAAAHARWNWETEVSRLVDLYGSLGH